MELRFWYGKPIDEKEKEIYPLETQKKIVELWLNNGGKRRTFKQMKHLYQK